MLDAMATTRPTAYTPSWAILLEQFYSQSGHPLPRIQQLNDTQIPQPYKSLLVHSSDMTPTLEKFYSQALGITVLNRDLQPDFYLREVLLNLAGDNAATNGARPVEYGVIRICLNRIPPAARRRVLEQQRPLGNILQGEAIPHISWPQAFFRVESDSRLTSLLRFQPPRDLYGRRNVLLDGSRHLLAEVIEILAPVDPAQSLR
jgi:hypothetical protein